MKRLQAFERFSLRPPVTRAETQGRSHHRKQDRHGALGWGGGRAVTVLQRNVLVKAAAPAVSTELREDRTSRWYRFRGWGHPGLGSCPLMIQTRHHRKSQNQILSR